MTLRSGDSVICIEDGRSTRAKRLRKVSVRPLRMRKPAARVMPRANEIARVRAERGDAEAFRRMQAQAMVVGQGRIELSMRIAQLEGPVPRN